MENRAHINGGMSVEPGQPIRDGRYVVTGLLGEGAQGETLDAVDKLDGRVVAIKRFQIRGAKSWKDVELAEREARVLAQLSHPALPKYIEHFEEDGALYLSMEKVEGESIAALRRRQAMMTEADVVQFLTDAASMLDYLHGRSPPVIHRDIKPGNVIRRSDGTFAFVDFGSVRDTLKPEGGSTVVGTFGYMAPEQFQGRALPSTDVYAVGVTALVMLTGREPEDLPHQGLAIDVGAALEGSKNPGLVSVLERMLDPNPDQRARSITQLLGGADIPSNRRDARSGAKNSRRKARSKARRGTGRRPQMPPPVRTVLIVGLLLAQVAVFAGLRVLVPAVLTFVSLVAGRAARRAARRVSGAGQRANNALTEARLFLTTHADVDSEVESKSERKKWRVRQSTDRPSRVRFDEDAFDQDIEDPRDAGFAAETKRATPVGR